VYLDAVASRIQAYKDAGAKRVEMHVEQQLPIDHLTGEEGATGTGDCVIVVEQADGTLLIDIVDLKFGKGVVVHALENEQLRMYASGAVRLFELVYGEFTRVRMGISQPRLQPEIDDDEIDMHDLRAFEKHCEWSAQNAVNTLAAKPEEVERVLYPAEKQCRFCDAKATCPAVAREMAKTVLDDFDNVPEDAPITPAAVAQAAVRKVPDSVELLAAFKGKTEMIRAWCDAVDAKTEALILSGEQVPGWKAVQGRKGNRTWSDPKEVERQMKQWRVREDVMYDFKLASPAELEKRMKGPEYLPPGEGAKPAKIRPTWWKSLVMWVTQSPGKPTVVPESDPRPALEIKPAVDDFQTVEEELV
jgi:hypothetical protein